MRIDLIPENLTGKLYQEYSKGEQLYLREMTLLSFIREYRCITEKDSYFDNEKGIVVVYRFKARAENLFLQVNGSDFPKGVFDD